MRSFRILSAASLLVLASGIALAADPLQVADPVTPADAVAPVDAVAPASDVASIDALADACELNFPPADADAADVAASAKGCKQCQGRTWCHCSYNGLPRVSCNPCCYGNLGIPQVCLD